ncbi:DUF2958 domain-containing protein [Alcaligenes faecalis]|uniref:DUF2958 domain-containing protein n=1 Tax=Alcaligenes faecalis TaxID=511 RepID=UPI00122C8A2D|nr:DUF2958 domain-containing protein [Alcaligenes faecalis]KAA1288934.1 DUF2958 domain-containing protein [Alcaligenes faecalis]WHQ43780.1 DUF2958 domain-containing protein [Alcaligenes faecalis]
MRLTDLQLALLRDNGLRCRHEPGFDPVPVAKAYTPDGRVVWLLAYTHADDPGRVHTLCDAGTGFPALIDIRLDDLGEICGPRGMRVALDPTFQPMGTLSAYAAAAFAAGAYVEDIAH